MTDLVVAEIGLALVTARLVCHYDVRPGDEALTHVDACIERFCALGRAGGFCPSVDSGRGEYRIARPAKRRGSNEVEALIGIGAMQSAAPQVLRNLLEASGTPETAPQTMFLGPVDAAFEDGRLVPPPVDDNEDLAYPVLAVGADFAVEIIDRSYRKTRRVLIEFATEAADTAFMPVQDAARVWGAVLSAGGFAPPVAAPDEAESFLGDVQVFDPWTVEIEVWIFEASESAWPALMNVLAVSVAPIARMIMVVVE